MKLKQIVALLLCISLLLLTLAACSSQDEDADPLLEEEPVIVDDDDIESPEAEHIHGVDCEHSPNIDFTAAMATFEPDTVMLKSGNLVITWAELYVFLFSTVNNLMQAYGAEIDWDDSAPDGSNVSDLILDYATDDAVSFLTYMHGIDELNFELSDEDLESFNEDINEIIAIYGSKEELEESLRENGGFYDFSIFENLYKLEYSIVKLLDHLYGEELVDFPEEQIKEFADEQGFMMAMHILRLKSEDGDDETPLEEAEDILSQLEARVGTNDFVDFFIELMQEHSEDIGGLSSFPDGYLFQSADMVPEFSETTAALKEGELSGIVETMYGYHIILRIPFDFDAVPIAYSGESPPRTLRRLAAFEDFDGIRQQWREALNVEFTPEYNAIDLSEIFKSTYN